jgi:mono/diheme cytochrome c family protein
MKKALLLIIVVPVILMTSCYNDNKETLYPAKTCDLTTVTYSGVIKNLTLTNCAYAGCHAGSNPSSGYDLSKYETLKLVAENGALLGTIRYENGHSPMPKGADRLPQCSIDQYAAWVAAGAPEN